MPSKRKNILFIISHLGVGGAQKLLLNLVNHFDRKLFSINIIAMSGNNPLEKQINYNDVRVIPLPRKWRYDMQPAHRIRQFIIKEQIDTVIALDLYCFFFVWYALLIIQFKPKVFISLHATKSRDFKHFLQSMIYVRLLSREEQIISVCDAQANYWSRVFWIPRKHFITIYNGVDVDYFHPSNNSCARNSIRSSLNIPEDALIILQVANITTQKRHEDSLLALRNLIKRNPSLPCYLLFVGQGPKDREHKLKDLAERLTISDRVKFCGLQSDVRPFYQAADIFTLSSESEAFSVAALEAMSMGLPCVLTEVGGACEMIVEGMNGYLVTPHNPYNLASGWLKAFENKDNFSHEKIRAWVTEHFNLTGFVQKYEDLLR